MAVASAHDVAAAIRRRLPGVGKKKLQKLLYYAQGHHLAHFGMPLFREAIRAWDMGPVCADFWRDEDKGRPAPAPTELDNGELNTIGYVVSRYGANTGSDLERLTHSESPWLIADRRRRRLIRTRDDLIGHDSMRAFFTGEGAATAGNETTQFDPADVARVIAVAQENLARPGRPDRIEDLLARLNSA